MKYSAEQVEATRESWSWWLWPAMNSREISTSKLALELASPYVRAQAERYSKGAKVVRESTPRSQIRRWLNRELTVTPENAFRCGEALRRLGVSFASGPEALIASAWSSTLIEFLDRLAIEEDGNWPALALFVALAESLQKQAFVSEWYIDFEQALSDFGLADYMRRVLLLHSTAIQLTESKFESLLARCNGGRGCTAISRKAISIARPEFGVSADLAMYNAWNSLQPWAEGLFVKCGGRMPPGQSFYLHWKTPDELVDDYKYGGDRQIELLDRAVNAIAACAPDVVKHEFGI